MPEEVLMRLKDDGTNFDFAPLRGYEAPENRRRTIHETLDRTLYIYDWGGKLRWEVPISEISTADKGYMDTWWTYLTQLKFYPDMINDDTTYYNVRVVNEDNPLQMMYPSWAGLYEGSLILQQSD